MNAKRCTVRELREGDVSTSLYIIVRIEPLVNDWVQIWFCDRRGKLSSLKYDLDQDARVLV